MKALQIIDHHLIIRETIRYNALDKVPIEDMPQVMDFLKIVYNYKRMIKISKK